MLEEVCNEARAVGLELHPDKTKILHNQPQRRQRRQPQQLTEHVRVCDMQVEVLPHTCSQKYLGRQFSFNHSSKTEVENRITAAWKKFHLYKRELTTKTYSLKGRLRLFEGTVTPTILYGTASWALTVELENRLRRTQRQMLRMIMSSPRRRRPYEHNNTNNTTDIPTQPNTPSQSEQHPLHNNINDNEHTDSNESDVDSTTPEIQIPLDNEAEDLEPWSDYIRRCTHEAERLIKDLSIDDWVSQHRRRKWRWAAKVATDTRDKWNLKAATWEPSLDRGYRARRRQARPQKRWSDDITEYLTNAYHDHNTQQNRQRQQQMIDGDDDECNTTNDSTIQHWTTAAREHHWWQQLEAGFVRGSTTA